LGQGLGNPRCLHGPRASEGLVAATVSRERRSRGRDGERLEVTRAGAGAAASPSSERNRPRKYPVVGCSQGSSVACPASSVSPTAVLHPVRAPRIFGNSRHFTWRPIRITSLRECRRERMNGPRLKVADCFPLEDRFLSEKAFVVLILFLSNKYVLQLC